MPEFSVLPANDAAQEAVSAAMPEDLAPYADYLTHLNTGEAGRLVPSDGEDVRMVRYRLSAAARRMGKKVIIRRAGNEILFWENLQA